MVFEARCGKCRHTEFDNVRPDPECPRCGGSRSIVADEDRFVDSPDEPDPNDGRPDEEEEA